MINNDTPHLKSQKNQNRRAALGRPAGQFKSPRTEHLSSPPLFSSLPSESSRLLPCMLLLLHTTSSSNLSSHHRGRKHLWWHMFFSCDVSQVSHCCISHCCIVGGNHGIDVHVLITQSNEWCKLSTYCCLKSASHIWVPQLLKIKP